LPGDEENEQTEQNEQNSEESLSSSGDEILIDTRSIGTMSSCDSAISALQ